jgi:endonuclease/exonuclease/phosphatase family metal-dependent hydrolase
MLRPNRWIAALLLPAATGCAPSSASRGDDAASQRTSQRIVIDGAFDDWAQVSAASSASTHDATAVARDVRTAADGEALFVRFTMPAPLVLQAHTAATRIVLDVDGDASTGRTAGGMAGADVVLEFSPAPTAGGARGGFAAWTVDGRRGTAHDAGFTALPTHVSQTFEARIERATLEAFTGTAVGERPRGRIVSDREGGASAVSADFTWRVPPAARVAEPAGADALARAQGTAVRVVVWNVADRSIRERPDVFARVMRALAPDVVLLDELPADTDGADLSTFLALLGPEWTFALGDGGGRQRAAVASRLPLEPAPGFARVGYPDSVRALQPLATFAQTRRDLATALDDGISTAGAIVDVGGRRVLFVAADLACCGGEESVEDRFRRMQADAIRTAAERAAGDDVHAVVIGGDLNLVGSRRPLDILARGADPHGGDLAPAYALQLDGRTAATWRQDGPFGPGRLDWLLHSPSALRVIRAFAFESGDLAAVALISLGLQAADSDVTSDHLPVVADLAWTRGARPPR